MAETPPLSIRLGHRQARVEAHMVRTGLALRAAVLDLVDLGLEVEEAEIPAKPAGKKAPAKAVLKAAETRVGVKPAAMDTSSVPVQARKAFNPQPKRGGK